MVDTDEYWKERSERRILAAEKTAKEMTIDLKKIYLDTVVSIDKEIEAFYGKYATDTGLSIQDVKKLLTDDELKQFRYEAKQYYADLSNHAYDPKYRNILKNQIYQSTTKESRKLYTLRRNVSRLDSLKMQMQHAIEKLYMKQNELFTSKLSDVYEDTYMHSIFDTQQATGMFQPFNQLNSSIVNKAVQQKWLGSNYSERIWNDKNRLIDTLETTFLQDVAIGKNPKAIASDMKKLTGVKYSNCERLARTEFNHIANEATMDSYKDTDGLDRYKYEATLDTRTSSYCRHLDNKVYLVKEAEVGVNYPPMHPNCRSTTIPYLEDIDYSKMERIATDPKTGKAYYISGDTSYEDWRKSLNAEQGKYFVASEKMKKQYKSDVKQLREYKKIATKAKKDGKSDLFAGLPTSTKEFQKMKYLEPEKWEVYKQNRRLI